MNNLYRFYSPNDYCIISFISRQPKPVPHRTIPNPSRLPQVGTGAPMFAPEYVGRKRWAKPNHSLYLRTHYFVQLRQAKWLNGQLHLLRTPSRTNAGWDTTVLSPNPLRAPQVRTGAPCS